MADRKLMRFTLKTWFRSLITFSIVSFFVVWLIRDWRWIVEHPIELLLVLLIVFLVEGPIYLPRLIDWIFRDRQSPFDK